MEVTRVRKWWRGYLQRRWSAETSTEEVRPSTMFSPNLEITSFMESPTVKPLAKVCFWISSGFDKPVVKTISVISLANFWKTSLRATKSVSQDSYKLTRHRIQNLHKRCLWFFNTGGNYTLLSCSRTNLVDSLHSLLTKNFYSFFHVSIHSFVLKSFFAIHHRGSSQFSKLLDHCSSHCGKAANYNVFRLFIVRTVRSSTKSNSRQHCRIKSV